jgi:dolichol-phosphate mannosyltransferase
LKILLIIPTLNEVKSIDPLIKKILFLKTNLTILFIDDKSNDGTREKIKSISKKKKFVKFLFRNNDLGLGSAIKSGFKYAFKKKFSFCITMDADGTHDPKKILLFLKIIKRNYFHIISTNRFLKKNSMIEWPFLRILLTKMRYYLVKIILNTSLDSSGNYRCYNLKRIKKKHMFLSKNKSYFFLIESLFYFEKLKYNIKEIPIYLNPRTFDSSKMRIIHILKSFLNLVQLRLRYF